jgi:hypothetical protein
LLVKVPLVVVAVGVAAAAQAEDEAVEVQPTVISESLEVVVDRATAAVDLAALQLLLMAVDSVDLLPQLLMAVLLPMVAMAVAAMATHLEVVEDSPGGKLPFDDASLFLFRSFSILLQTT